MESFSSSVKAYLCEKSLEELGIGENSRVKWKTCCSKAFLRSVFLSLCHREGDVQVLSTDREALLEIVAYLLIRTYDVEARPLPRERGNCKGAILSLPLGTKERILSDPETLPLAGCERCRILYIRGAFLSHGTILNPEKGYHAAILTPSEREGKALSEVLESFDVYPKMKTDEKGCLLYLKESSKIEDLLSVMGAQRFALDLMNNRIDKNLRGNINRRQNFEDANLGRTVNSAQNAIAAIRYLEEVGELPRLPQALQSAAKLRLSHPEVSLGELVAHSEEVITKSGLNHRLKKLCQLAEKRKNEEEVQ